MPSVSIPIITVLNINCYGNFRVFNWGKSNKNGVVSELNLFSIDTGIVLYRTRLTCKAYSGYLQKSCSPRGIYRFHTLNYGLEMLFVDGGITLLSVFIIYSVFSFHLFYKMRGHKVSTIGNSRGHIG